VEDIWLRSVGKTLSLQQRQVEFEAQFPDAVSPAAQCQRKFASEQTLHSSARVSMEMVSGDEDDERVHSENDAEDSCDQHEAVVRQKGKNLTRT